MLSYINNKDHPTDYTHIDGKCYLGKYNKLNKSNIPHIKFTVLFLYTKHINKFVFS